MGQEKIEVKQESFTIVLGDIHNHDCVIYSENVTWSYWIFRF